tara:strand:- start:5680 stop:6267 length:588 start_codon:yes stop_codon:yes gene_type:complete
MPRLEQQLDHNSFVHVPRTGGTAMWEAVGRKGYPTGARGQHLQHITASRLRELQPWRFDDKIVIGVFRNPWPRLISLWSFLYHDSEDMTPANFRAWINGGMMNRWGKIPTLYEDEPGESPISLLSPQRVWLDDPALMIVHHDNIGNFTPAYDSGRKERHNGGWWEPNKDWYDGASRRKVMIVIEPDLDFQNERNL